MPELTTCKTIIVVIGFCCLILLVLNVFVPRNPTVYSFVPPSSHLRTFCENLNDSTQPLPDYNPQNAAEETDLFFADIASASDGNCQRFRQAFMRQEESPLAAQEAAYPLAFTIVAHRNVRQLARLLRMLHRPANFYCIHIDRRSSPEFSRAVEGLATCFGPNVHVVPPESRMAVTWGDASVLRPQFVCAEWALKQPGGWRYLLNLAAEEVPLRTNLELIAAMKALNGSNLLESVRLGDYASRVKGVKLSYQMQWYKGSLYGAFRRDFLDFALHRPATQPLIEVIFSSDKELRHPDELFFQTVTFNAHIRAPGACLYTPLPTEVSMGYPARYVIWSHPMSFCPTKYVRDACILGNPHVPELRRTFHLFANKMHADYYPEAYDCMEQWYFSRLHREWKLGHVDWESFQPWAYTHLTCSRYHQD